MDWPVRPEVRYGPQLRFLSIMFYLLFHIFLAFSFSLPVSLFNHSPSLPSFPVSFLVSLLFCYSLTLPLVFLPPPLFFLLLADTVSVFPVLSPPNLCSIPLLPPREHRLAAATAGIYNLLVPHSSSTHHSNIAKG